MGYEVSVDSFGTKRWYKKGILHREDGPAIEYANGNSEWYLNGVRHREDGPAVESPNGDKEWHLNGILHRGDGPAVEYANGNSEWYLNGRRFKAKETWFKALKNEDKMKALFNDSFMKG